MQANWTTSGIRQRGNIFYMPQRNTLTGETREVEVTPYIVETLQQVTLDSGRQAHTWTHKAGKGYTPSVCGAFGCAVCDAENLEARLASLYAE